MKDTNIIWKIQIGDTNEWFEASPDTYEYCDYDIKKCREIFGEVEEENNLNPNSTEAQGLPPY